MCQRAFAITGVVLCQSHCTLRSRGDVLYSCAENGDLLAVRVIAGGQIGNEFLLCHGQFRAQTGGVNSAAVYLFLQLIDALPQYFELRVGLFFGCGLGCPHALPICGRSGRRFRNLLSLCPYPALTTELHAREFAATRFVHQQHELLRGGVVTESFGMNVRDAIAVRIG